jgi:D-arabinose 1-dehydrogenase-like Zn-dependent alcohol dehydrogenase
MNAVVSRPTNPLRKATSTQDQRGSQHGRTYPLAEIGKAYDRVEQGKVRFRAVIMP